MNQYDHIEEVEKNIDEIEVVEKFNPFHDARGKFSSSNGFASYSANPNTRAGAMAIARSAAAGHGNTMNVHRQSYGENITQNAQWIGRGAKTPAGGTITNGASHLRGKERFSGLAGASATGANWQAQNAARGRTTKPGKQTSTNQKPQQNQQQQTKPTQAKPAQAKPSAQKPAQQQANPNTKGGSLSQDVAGVNLTGSNKLAIVQRNIQGQATKTRKVANDNYQSRVAGSDISKTFDATKIKGSDRAIDKVAKAQGWNKPATVTNDLETFQKAAVKSGRVMFRSVDGNGRETAGQVCHKTMTDGNTSLGGNGGKYYGGGLYLTDCKISAAATGRSRNASNLTASSRESYYYGNRQMMATVHPNAKIATPKQANQMKTDFKNMSKQDQAKYGNDWGTYIASKGYDGAKWHADSDPTAYTTIYNKSALIFYGGTADAY